MKPTTTATCGILALAALFSPNSRAALIHHWALDETSLPTNISGAWGEVVDSTGNSAGGRMFGYPTTSALPSGVVGLAGPVGFGTAYNFDEVAGSNGISGVFTNSNDAIPTVGDFSLYVRIATTHQQAAQGHLFSDNNGQAKRANLYFLGGSLSFFLNGGGFDTDNDGISNGDAFGFLASGTVPGTVNLFDGGFHEVGLAREGARFDLLVDGAVAYSATATGAAVFDNATSWMIGRQRSSGGDLEATIADVKIYDTYLVPEPSGFALLGLGGLLFLRRRR